MSGENKVKRQLHVRKGDLVVVMSGESKTWKKEGDKKVFEPREVLEVNLETGKIIVSEVNMRSKHIKKSQEYPKGGILKREQPIDASNVMLWDTKKNCPTRIRRPVQKDENGQVKRKENGKIVKFRVSVASGEPIGNETGK